MFVIQKLVHFHVQNEAAQSGPKNILAKINTAFCGFSVFLTCASNAAKKSL